MRRSILALSLLGVLVAIPAFAQPARTFDTQYSITVLGIPVGRANFVSRISGDSFSIEGSLASAGVARIVERTDGTTSVSGSLTDEGTRPASYLLDYRSDDKAQRTAIRFSGGDVTATQNEPPLRRRNPNDWVALDESHLRQVVDPISSTLIRAGSAGEVCDRTLRIYDGEMRADLRLTPAGTRDGRVTCNARFAPVAGYRPSRSAIRFLRDRSRIAITFAPLADTGFYAPVEATVGTQIGTLRIAATSVQQR